MTHQLTASATNVSAMAQPIGSQTAPMLRMVNRTQNDFVCVLNVMRFHVAPEPEKPLSPMEMLYRTNASS